MELTAIFALAFLTEGVTEYFFADFLALKKYLRYISALIGIALCLIYKVDALSLFLDLSPQYAIPGQILTGIIMGRGANFLHDFYSRYGKPK